MSGPVFYNLAKIFPILKTLLVCCLPCQLTFVPDLKFHPHCYCCHFHDVSSFFLWNQKNVLMSFWDNWAQANKTGALKRRFLFRCQFLITQGRHLRFEQNIIMLLENPTSQQMHYWVCAISVYFHDFCYILTSPLRITICRVENCLPTCLGKSQPFLASTNCRNFLDFLGQLSRCCQLSKLSFHPCVLLI